MGQIKQRGQYWRVEAHELRYTRPEGDGGFVFPCDELGFVIWERLPQAARENLRYCESGALGAPTLHAFDEWREEPSEYYCPGGCGGTVFVMNSLDVDYCDACMNRLAREYPQGWKHYPGDVCVHGRYVGGCGVDWLCGACEGGA